MDIGIIKGLILAKEAEIDGCENRIKEITEVNESYYYEGKLSVLKRSLFELKSLHRLARIDEALEEKQQEQAAEQPTEQLEGDEHLSVLEFCEKHEMGLYKNKETFTDFADDTFKAGSIIIIGKDGSCYSLNDNNTVAIESFAKELEKGNIIELHNPNA